MYFVDFVKNLIKKNNRGVLIWLIINSILVACLLGEAFGGGVTGYALGVVIYVAILALSLSPLGESILRWQNGCEKITRKEYLDRIMPLFNEVFSKAKTENPEIPDDVQLITSGTTVKLTIIRCNMHIGKRTQTVLTFTSQDRLCCAAPYK